jgi:hypothetical protein
MSRQASPFAIHAGLLLGLTACSGSETPVAAETPKPAQSAAVATPPPAPSVCAASPAWISSPTEPSEVASSETFCDFYQFSWQWFLAQVSPADPSNPTGDRVFESANRVVDPKGGANQCAMNALSGKLNAAKMLAMRVPKPLDAVDSDDFEENQADGNPLYDQAGNVLYFNMWYSPEECQATSSGFVAGTLEIKTAWRVLPAADPTYYTMQATLPSGGSPVTLGLVGFHLVNWTSAHPEMIWASFEHKTNAPLCDGTSATSGWSFASNDAAACLAANPSPSGSINPNCASYDFNTPPQNVPTPTPPTGPADEVCRLFENGNQPGTSVNGNDNAANLLAIQQLNEALVGSNGLLTNLPADNAMAVWKNYEMVGGLWTKNGAASGNPPVPNAGGPADPTSPQRGSLELTNMTMETYQQGASSFIPNCFGCHNFDPSTPLDVSHIATKFLLPPSTVAAEEAKAKPGAAQ